MLLHLFPDSISSALFHFSKFSVPRWNYIFFGLNFHEPHLVSLLNLLRYFSNPGVRNLFQILFPLFFNTPKLIIFCSKQLLLVQLDVCLPLFLVVLKTIIVDGNIHTILSVHILCIVVQLPTSRCLLNLVIFNSTLFLCKSSFF